MTSLLLTAVLWAGQDPDPEVLPKGPPPTLLAIPGGETFVSTYTVQRPVTVSKAVVVDEGGKKVTRIVTETVMVTETRARSVSLKGATGRTVGGKKLTAEEVAKAILKPQVVAISADGKPVDPGYLRVMKSGTLVLELPAAAAMPVPIPLPAIKEKEKVEVKDKAAVKDKVPAKD